MNKNKVIYIALLSIFVVIILILDITFYINYSNISGKLKIEKKYYEINYITENSNVKLYNGAINVNVHSLNEPVYFDIYNSGNLSVSLDKVSFDSITTNVDDENFEIKSSLNKNDIIKGGETRRVYIDVYCNNCKIEDNFELAFNAKYIFK